MELRDWKHFRGTSGLGNKGTGEHMDPGISSCGAEGMETLMWNIGTGEHLWGKLEQETVLEKIGSGKQKV